MSYNLIIEKENFELKFFFIFKTIFDFKLIILLILILKIEVIFCELEFFFLISINLEKKIHI